MAFSRASALDFFSTFTWPTTQLSSTVMLLNRLKDWNTMPTLDRYREGSTPLPVTSWPWKTIWPLVGVSSRLMHRRRVDLPEPEAPMMEVTSPGRTVKSMSRSTWWSPKDLDRCRTSKMASLFITAPPCSVRA